jgi:hypothetical protein
MIFTLKIEHPIHDFETWKVAFARDPAGRKQSGVRRYRVFRPVDDPKYVIIDLDFDGPQEAQAFLESMRKVWSQVELSLGLAREGGAVKVGPQARIVEEVDSREF